MRKSCLFIILVIAIIALPSYAQKKSTVKKKRPVVEVPQEITKFDEMLDATQQVVIVDSVVVSKQTFLSVYNIGAESGSISTYNQFFRTDDQPYATVCVNQLGNKCWFSNDGKLYTIDKLGVQWSEPVQLEGLGRYQRTNYPFVLSAGTTLYFAAISDEGLGGLDIYVSRYDSETGKYLLAENIGLPFNSEANDYMYVVDELNNIGYFATDRRQPDGSVCIYTFIPNEKRLTYHADELSEEQIRSRARIDCIADTWGDGNARQEALSRLQAMMTTTKRAEKQDFVFVVNDDVTYTSLADFRNADNRDRYNELSQMQKRYEQLGTEMDKARQYYATKAAAIEKKGLRTEILEYEQEYYQLETNIRQLEKIIRNSEIKHLKP